jgi:putative solute:sodium symporter small subunit
MSKIENADAHWSRTRNLTIVTLIIWFFFSFVVHWFGAQLNEFKFLGFPFGFYMAAQGSPLVFVLLIIWSVRRQEKIDADFGVSE